MSVPALLAIPAVTLVMAVVLWRTPKADGQVAAALRRLHAAAAGLGAAASVLWLVLPETAVLGTFGRPNSVGDIDTRGKILIVGHA